MLVRLLYASRATREIDDALVASIVGHAQKYNVEHGITGILCSSTQGNVFLQALGKLEADLATDQTVVAFLFVIGGHKEISPVLLQDATTPATYPSGAPPEWLDTGLLRRVNVMSSPMTGKRCFGGT